MHGGLREIGKNVSLVPGGTSDQEVGRLRGPQIFPGTRGIGNCPEKYGHYDEGPAVRHESP